MPRESSELIDNSIETESDLVEATSTIESKEATVGIESEEDFKRELDRRDAQMGKEIETVVAAFERWSQAGSDIGALENKIGYPERPAKAIIDRAEDSSDQLQIEIDSSTVRRQTLIQQVDQSMATARKLEEYLMAAKPDVLISALAETFDELKEILKKVGENFLTIQELAGQIYALQLAHREQLLHESGFHDIEEVERRREELRAEESGINTEVWQRERQWLGLRKFFSDPRRNDLQHKKQRIAEQRAAIDVLRQHYQSIPWGAGNYSFGNAKDFDYWKLQGLVVHAITIFSDTVARYQNDRRVELDRHVPEITAEQLRTAFIEQELDRFEQSIARSDDSEESPQDRSAMRAEVRVLFDQAYQQQLIFYGYQHQNPNSKNSASHDLEKLREAYIREHPYHEEALYRAIVNLQSVDLSTNETAAQLRRDILDVVNHQPLATKVEQVNNLRRRWHMHNSPLNTAGRIKQAADQYDPETWQVIRRFEVLPKFVVDVYEKGVTHELLRQCAHLPQRLVDHDSTASKSKLVDLLVERESVGPAISVVWEKIRWNTEVTRRLRTLGQRLSAADHEYLVQHFPEQAEMLRLALVGIETTKEYREFDQLIFAAHLRGLHDQGAVSEGLATHYFATYFNTSANSVALLEKLKHVVPTTELRQKYSDILTTVWSRTEKRTGSRDPKRLPPDQARTFVEAWFDIQTKASADFPFISSLPTKNDAVTEYLWREKSVESLQEVERSLAIFDRDVSWQKMLELGMDREIFFNIEKIMALPSEQRQDFNTMMVPIVGSFFRGLDDAPSARRFRFLIDRQNPVLTEACHRSVYESLAQHLITEQLSIATVPDLLKKFGLSADCRPVLSMLLERGHLALVLGHAEEWEGLDRSIGQWRRLVGYKKDIGIPSREALERYSQYTADNRQLELMDLKKTVTSTFAAVTGSESQSPEVMKLPYYADVVGCVYQNNAGSWTSFKANEGCADRSDQLADLKIKPEYVIDLQEGVEMTLRGGQALDEAGLNRYQLLIKQAQTRLERVGYDREQMRQDFALELQELGKNVINLDQYRSTEEMLYALLLAAGVDKFSYSKLKELLLAYELAEFEDVQAYVAGTQNRAEQAKNKDYAYLLELHEFYSDHLKEAQRKIVEQAHRNPQIVAGLATWWQDRQNVLAAQRRTELRNRLRLGENSADDFLVKIMTELQKRSKSQGQRFKLIEQAADGQNILGPRGKMIAGLINGRQESYQRAIQAITDLDIGTGSIQVGDQTLLELLESFNNTHGSGSTPEAVAKIMAEEIQAIFSEEVTFVERELAKFKPAEAAAAERQQVEVVGKITKNHTSAHARAVGGTVTTDTDTITVPTCTTATITTGSSSLNAPIVGSITAVKVVVNDNGGAKTIFDFPLFINDAPVTSGATYTYLANENVYTVTETADPGYTGAFSGDCDSDGSLLIEASQSKVCILTNNDIDAPVAFVPVPPLIDVVKVPSPLALPDGPGLVTYTYTTRNIGTVPMTNVTMVGDTCSPIVLTSGDANADNKLDVDETWIYNCSTTLSETHTNTVVATGWANDISSVDVASATVIVGDSIVPPLIHITKTPSQLTLSAGGGMITYTKKITNPGEVALSSVMVTDDKCSPLNYVSGDTNSDLRLDVDETWTYTCRTNVTKTITNTAIASGYANGLVVRDFAVATVVVASAVPLLPNTGGTSDQNVLIWSIVVIAILNAAAILLHVIRKKQSI
jgi:hypothetical protein